MSYSAAASQGGRNDDPSAQQTTTYRRGPSQSENRRDDRQAGVRQKRSPSPAQIPVTEKEGEDLYVLTLLTDQAHHKRMTALRDKYFPKHINKLEAHITFFHALPASRLNDHILPTVQDVASKTDSFKVHAITPFRLKRGVAISVAKSNGSAQAREVYHALQRPWLDAGFLSEQDRGGCHLHYTVMNKVDGDEKVTQSLRELQDSFHGDWGVAEGLGLWRYDRGFWQWERRFDFRQANAT